MASPIVTQSARSIQPGIREGGQVQLHNSMDTPQRHETDARIDSSQLQRG
jgi:hypothetical protein